LPLSAFALTERVSIDSAWIEGNNSSNPTIISADGRYVLFQSSASNLVVWDTNGVDDVFVRDTVTNTTIRVSVDSAWVEGNNSSYSTAISADARYVLFQSSASNLVVWDTNGQNDVFVRDTVAYTTTRVSVDSSWIEGNGFSYPNTITPDWRYVLFSSTASNLVPGDTNALDDIFIKDTLTNTTSIVSVNSSWNQSNDGSSSVGITPDWRYVLFSSTASNLVPGDVNGQYDVFVRDTINWTTNIVSVDDGWNIGNSESEWWAIYWSWRYVLFTSLSDNLVSWDVNGQSDVFIRDTINWTTNIMSVDSSWNIGDNYSFWPIITPDGRYILFYSDATNLVTGDTNGQGDIFIRDIVASTTLRVNIDSMWMESNSRSYPTTITPDWRYALFQSYATNLVTGDTNGQGDVFVRDTVSNTTTRISVDGAWIEGNNISNPAWITPDGKYILFYSSASNLVVWDTNGVDDVFLSNWQAIFTNPALVVWVSPWNQTIISGSTASFAITVTNTWDVGLSGIVVSSLNAPNCNNTIWYLAQWATTRYICNQPNIITSFTNTVSVKSYAYTGWVLYTAYWAEWSASWDVQISTIAPAVSITKTPASQSILSGGSAFFIVTITNTGDVDLSGLVVVDPLVPNCGNVLWYLAKWASTWYNCVLNNVTSSFTSTTTVSWYAYTGWVMLMSYPASALSLSTVNVTVPVVYNPLITITQTPWSQNIFSWTTAVISLTITNTWDVDLSWVVVSNPTMPSCDTIIWYLAQWASTWYNCFKSLVATSFISTTYTTWYLYTWGTIDFWSPTSANISSNINVITPPPPLPVFNPAISIVLTPNTQTITAWSTATLTVTVTNTGNDALSWVVVSNPTIPWCNATIWYLPVWWVAWYSCQTNVLATSLVTTIYTSWYVYTGWVEYTWITTNANNTATITVIPVVVTPPVVLWGGGWGFAGGGGSSSYTQSQTLSTLPQVQTTPSLSTLPQNTTEPVAVQPTTPTNGQPNVIVAYPQWSAPQPPFVAQWSSQSYPVSSNGTDDYQLPYASLRQLLSSLTR
jgi:uncharacterized repeat protein (TIGR01451 family)